MIVRYGAAVVAFLEALLFARILGPASYGTYALIIQVVNLMLLATTGSAAGYVYAYYKQSEERPDSVYLTATIGQFVLGGLVATALLTALNPYLAISGLLFLIYSPYFIAEPMLRVRNQFSLTVIGKALGSVLTLALGVAVLLGGGPPLIHSIDLSTAIAVLLGGNITGYLVFYGIVLLRGHLPLPTRDTLRGIFRAATWARYWRDILYPVWPYAVSSSIYLLFMYVDRLFIEQFHPSSALSVYSLGWQLSQGALLLITSLNVISSVRIGENLSHRYPVLVGVLRRQLMFTALAGLLSVLLLLAGVTLLSLTLYRDFTDLITVTALINGGYLAFGIVGSVTNLLFLQRRFRQLIFGNLVGLCVTLAGNILTVVNGWWYGVAIGISAATLVGMSLYLLWCVHRVMLTMRSSPA